MDDPPKRGDHPHLDGRSRTRRTLPAIIPVPTKLLSRLSLYRVTVEIALDNTPDNLYTIVLLAEDYALNLIRYLIRYFIYLKLVVSFFLNITNINSCNYRAYYRCNDTYL